MNIEDRPVAPPSRPVDAHKGTMGKVLIVAGSRPFSGAAVLAAHGASRGGAGLIQAAVPESLSLAFAQEIPSVVVCPVRETGQGRIATTACRVLQELAAVAHAVVVGPGLGQSSGLLDLLERLLSSRRPPVVLDADALNLLAQLARTDMLQANDVLTPHPMEAARLMGEGVPIVPLRRHEVAQELAAKFGCVVVLKGPATSIAVADRVIQNNSGNAALATGGTGDVLAGLIGALLGRGMSGFDAASRGVWAHGAAADWLVSRSGKEGLQPLELADALPRFVGGERTAE